MQIPPHRSESEAEVTRFHEERNRVEAIVLLVMSDYDSALLVFAWLIWATFLAVTGFLDSLWCLLPTVFEAPQR